MCIRRGSGPWLTKYPVHFNQRQCLVIEAWNFHKESVHFFNTLWWLLVAICLKISSLGNYQTVLDNMCSDIHTRVSMRVYSLVPLMAAQCCCIHDTTLGLRQQSVSLLQKEYLVHCYLRWQCIAKLRITMLLVRLPRTCAGRPSLEKYRMYASQTNSYHW